MPHADILDQPEQLKRPLAGSVALHLSVFAAAALVSWIGSRPGNSWGSPTPSAGSFSIGVVRELPMPAHRGAVNPVANDTESAVPQPPPKPVEKARAEEPDEDAIAIRSRNAKKKPAPVPASRNTYRAKQIDQPNQLYSSEGQALVSPLVGQTGAGGIGVGPGTPFGNKFGYYVDLLRQKVGQKWQTADVDPRLQNAPPVVVTFTILRDGSVRDIRVAQRSGNFALDASAQRAIADAAPFPPLPQGFDKSEAPIEFWFRLKR
jgi:protein TonB